MMERTQISLEPELHRRAKARAAEMGISLAEYFRRLAREDLDDAEPRKKGDISAIFGLGNSGGSDIAGNKDKYLGEAVVEEYLRDIGELPRPE